MKDFFAKALNFLRITDEQGRLSITNLVAIATTAQVLIPQVTELYSQVVPPALHGDYVQLGLFGFGLLNYLGKRYVAAHAENASMIAGYEKRIGELEAQIEALRS